MALNDITIFDDGTFHPGSKRFNVPGQGRAGGIKAGELVFKVALGSPYVTAWTAGVAASAVRPSVGTDYLVGLAVNTSTETATANGTVDVIPNLPGMTYLVNPLVAATFGTGTTPSQSTYDALVGDRVYLNYAATTGKITALAVDITSGCGGAVVEPLDVLVHPGKVRISLRQALNYFT